jgi:hypothetical protein
MLKTNHPLFFILILLSGILFTMGTAVSENLPRVLIIGDSISIGYTPYVADMLKGEAVVQHNKGNAQYTDTGLKKLDDWLGDTRWDVIHFNWGLWDFCYRHPDSKEQGKRDKVNGIICTPLGKYGENLKQLVCRLKKTDAALIWANTTMVPEGEAGRFVGDDLKYNRVAAEIMQKHHITINDLNSVSREFSPELFVKHGNVHYTEAGYRRLAAQVAEKIREEILAKRNRAPMWSGMRER